MQIRRWIRLFMVVLVCGALLFFNAGDVMALKVGDKAPDFTLTRYDGRKDQSRPVPGQATGGAVLLYLCLWWGLNEPCEVLRTGIFQVRGGQRPGTGRKRRLRSGE